MKSKRNNLLKKITPSILGLGVGVVNGFFGAGGGMLVVPIFEHSLNLETKNAHATAVLTIFPLCIISAITYLINGTSININILPVTVGVLIGGIIGSILLTNLNNKFINFLFDIVMIIAGFLMIFRN